MYIIYIYVICLQHIMFLRQCQRDTSCKSRRELSNAIVKLDFRKAGVEIWPFPFRKGFFEGGLGGLWAPPGPPVALWALICRLEPVDAGPWPTNYRPGGCNANFHGFRQSRTEPKKAMSISKVFPKILRKPIPQKQLLFSWRILGYSALVVFPMMGP